MDETKFSSSQPIPSSHHPINPSFSGRFRISAHSWRRLTTTWTTIFGHRGHACRDSSNLRKDVWTFREKTKRRNTWRIWGFYDFFWGGEGDGNCCLLMFVHFQFVDCWLFFWCFVWVVCLFSLCFCFFLITSIWSFHQTVVIPFWIFQGWLGRSDTPLVPILPAIGRWFTLAPILAGSKPIGFGSQEPRHRDPVSTRS